jgi:nucleotide-binding universal stress UspA family protein
MKRFKNILFLANPIENVESALKQALSIYDLEESRITIVEAANDISSSFVEAGIISDGLRDEILAERRKNAEALIQNVNVSQEIEVKLLTGTPFIEVIQEVIRGNYDLLIKPSAGVGTLDRLLGSNDMHILRKCPCPVWIVKPTRKHKHKKIIAAVDPDPTQTNAELNQLILELASSLSAHHNAELHVVAAWGLQGQHAFRLHQYQAELDQLRKGMKKTTRHWLDELTTRFESDGVELRAHLIEGRASDVILKEAKGRSADLIVMGTVGRVGISGYFMGNTAERILADIGCSVLTVKPSGFQSPITV